MCFVVPWSRQGEGEEDEQHQGMVERDAATSNDVQPVARCLHKLQCMWAQRKLGVPTSD